MRLCKFFVPMMLLIFVSNAFAANKGGPKPTTGKFTKAAEVKDDIVGSVVAGGKTLKVKATGDLVKQFADLDGKTVAIQGTVDGDTVTATSVKEAGGKGKNGKNKDAGGGAGGGGGDNK